MHRLLLCQLFCLQFRQPFLSLILEDQILQNQDPNHHPLRAFPSRLHLLLHLHHRHLHQHSSYPMLLFLQQVFQLPPHHLQDHPHPLQLVSWTWKLLFFGVSFEDLGADLSPLVFSDFAAIVY